MSSTAPENGVPARDEDDSLPTRRSLLSRLRNLGDDASWRTFFDTYWRLIYNVARRSGLSDDFAQEVVQDTVICVARKMPEFRYDPKTGSFKQWLLLITRRRIQDHLRRFYRAQNSAAAEALSEAAVEAGHIAAPDVLSEADWLEAWRQNIFDLALARVRQRVNPKHYQIFDFCVLQNRSAPEVARMFRMNIAQVYLAKHRVTSAVKKAASEIETELKNRPG